VPVVVTLNDVPERTKRAFTALGATVVKHELTISKHVYKTAALDEWSWIKGVISTYLRVEIHLIVKENRHLFNAAQVDTQYVIWGDLDTIWLRNFDSCTLAKPTLLSVSGCARSLPPRLALYGQREAPVSGARAGARSAGTWDPNAGIGYYNVTAMSMIFDDMVAYAVTKDFKFSALDNTLMVRAWAVVPPDSWPRPQYASAAAELTPRARRRSLRGAASRRCPTFSTGGPTVRPRPAHLECQRCTSSGHPPLTPAGPGAQGATRPRRSGRGTRAGRSTSCTCTAPSWTRPSACWTTQRWRAGCRAAPGCQSRRSA